MGNGIIEYLAECVLKVIYSAGENCLICGCRMNKEEDLCEQCINKIQYCEDKFVVSKENVKIECYSSTYYASVIADMIKRLKYKSDFLAGEFLAKLLIKTLKENNLDFDLITFIPMSKKAYKKRGFNQSEFLAHYVSKGIRKSSRKLLIKKFETTDQIGLSGISRWSNLESCFSAVNTSKIKDKKIILIDDVITTGATAFLCAQLLLKHGAEKVTVLTVAKSRL